MPISITEVMTAAGPTVHVGGDVDISNADQLTDRILAVLGRATPRPAPVVTVDLSAVTFLDSTGLSALVASHNAAQERAAQLVFSRPPRNVAELLSITGLDGVLAISANTPPAEPGQE